MVWSVALERQENSFYLLLQLLNTVKRHAEQCDIFIAEFMPKYKCVVYGSKASASLVSSITMKPETEETKPQLGRDTSALGCRVGIYVALLSLLSCK